MITSPWSYAYGHLDVTVVVLAPPADDVRAQLKPRMRLAGQTLTPPGTHPQVLMFGQHSRVRPWYRIASRGGHYDEWIVATPFLEWEEDGRFTPWATMSRLYLDSLWFTMLGWAYGYPKKLARMAAAGESYQVRTFPGGRPRVEMQWRPAGPEAPWERSPSATALAPLFGQPFVEQLGLLPWLGSRMWFELGSGTIQPVTLAARIEDGCAPGFRGRTLDVGSIDHGVPGAFRLSCDWMLSRPFLAGSLPPQLRPPMPPSAETGSPHG